MSPGALEQQTVAPDASWKIPDGVRRKPVIVTVPSRDLAFRVHVEAAMCGEGGSAPDALEAALRQAYPHVVVHASDTLGTIVPDEARWYVYRDPDGAEATATPAPWWDDLSLARTVIGADGRYIEANESAARLFGVSREQIIGATAGVFTKHARSDIVRDRLFEKLRSIGELCSTAVVVRPDGSEQDIDFHTSRSASGECTTVMRPRRGLSPEIANAAANSAQQAGHERDCAHL